MPTTSVRTHVRRVAGGARTSVVRHSRTTNRTQGGGIQIAGHPRQAIETTYKGPTNSRGSRVYAKADAGKVSVSWDHALGSIENHDAAARALAAKFGWEGRMYRGGLTKGGYAYVFAD